MKTISTLFLFFTLAIVSFPSCNADKKSDETYLLKMRLDKGDKFGQDISMDMDMIMMKMKMEMGADFEVIDSNAAGKDLKVTYTKMNMEMGNAAMEAMNDSLVNVNNRKFVGKSVIITLEGSKVIEVKGFEAFLDSSDQATKETIKKMFSKESINSMWGMMFGMYPNMPVKIGQTWTAQNNMDISGINMAVKTIYTLKSVKNDIAAIGLEGTIDSKGSMSPKPGTNIEMDMKGTQIGTMHVKLSDGYIKTGNYDMDIEAMMGIKDQKIPMKLKMKYTITGK